MLNGFLPEKPNQVYFLINKVSLVPMVYASLPYYFEEFPNQINRSIGPDSQDVWRGIEMVLGLDSIIWYNEPWDQTM